MLEDYASLPAFPLEIISSVAQNDDLLPLLLLCGKNELMRAILLILLL